MDQGQLDRIEALLWLNAFLSFKANGMCQDDNDCWSAARNSCLNIIQMMRDEGSRSKAVPDFHKPPEIIKFDPP